MSNDQPQSPSQPVSQTARPDIASLARMPRGKRSLFWPVVAGGVAVLVLGGWWLTGSSSQSAITYDTRPVQRGDLVVTVIATGTVQPTTQVEISSEQSGTLAAVLVDYNDSVTEGQVLARLDDTKLRAQQVNAEAQLVSARARLASAEATQTETADALDSAEALDRRGLNTRSVRISARAAHDRALAAVETAKAEVTLAEANLQEKKADLEKASIRSPINGIVLDRTAERGAIVQASMTAPILFTLAEDLTRMELNVAIDEADIGRVAVGQSAVFTVDAYPGRRFDAQITSLRFAPDTSTDVVTYTAVLRVENKDLLLRPGMTATATIMVSKEEGTLLVPVAALRYAPPVQASGSGGGAQGLAGLLMPGRPGGSQPRAGKVDGSGVWVLRQGAPLRVGVTPGASDGTNMAVTSDDLAEGDAVILSQREAR